MTDDNDVYTHGYVMSPNVYFSARGVELDGYDAVTDITMNMVIPWDELPGYLVDFEKGALKYHNEHKE